MKAFGKHTSDPRTARPVAVAAKPKTSRDQRAARRKSTRTLGYVVCPTTGRELECVVLDMSASGARIILNLPPRKPFTPEVQVPQTFTLKMPNDGIEIDCRLEWKDVAAFGASFLSAFRPSRPI